MAHTTVWISRIRLKRRDFVLVNDGKFGIDEQTPVASRMYLGYHEHCSPENYPIHIRRQRVERKPYLAMACGNPRCPLQLRIGFNDRAALERFTFDDLGAYCKHRMRMKRRKKKARPRLRQLDIKKLERLLMLLDDELIAFLEHRSLGFSLD